MKSIMLRFTILLGIAGLCLLLISSLWFGFTITVPFEKGTSWWTQVPWQAIVTLIGGIGALITYLLNRAQKEEHFERQALNDQFKDTLDRLASDNVALKTNAVIRLAEMAEQCLPGKKPWPPTVENYPFFPRVATQLAALLHLEPQTKIRDEVIKAIGRMSRFAANGNLSLFFLLINEFADVNRAAIRSFILLLAEYIPTKSRLTEERSLEDISDADLVMISNLSPFVSNDEANRYCMKFLLKTAEYNRAIASNIITNRYREISVTEIKNSASTLIASRDAISVCLKHLPAHILYDNEIMMSSFSRIDLTGCFLAGCNLSNCYINHNFLERWSLNNVNLIGADLSNAHIHHSHLIDVNLQYANLIFASLSFATILTSDLSKAMFISANLKGVYIDGNTRLFGTNLQDVMIENARLGSIEIKGSLGDGQLEANFTGVNWWDAESIENEELRNWLETYYPKPKYEVAPSSQAVP